MQQPTDIPGDEVPPTNEDKVPLVGPPLEELFEERIPVRDDLPEIFFDTNVISKVVSRGAYNHDEATLVCASRDLWAKRGILFNPVVSPLLLMELRRGDRDAAERRMRLVAWIDVFEITPAVFDFAGKLADAGAFQRYPQKKGQRGFDLDEVPNDAFHVAFATIYGIPLLTSYDEGIIKENTQTLIKQVCEKEGFPFPLIFTPTTKNIFEIIHHQLISQKGITL